MKMASVKRLPKLLIRPFLATGALAIVLLFAAWSTANNAATNHPFNRQIAKLFSGLGVYQYCLPAADRIASFCLFAAHLSIAPNRCPLSGA